MSYRLTETAEEDLAGILRYIAERDGTDRANHVYEKFLELFESLPEMPSAGFTRPHLTGYRLRWRLVFRFIVIYDPEATPVTVMRVLHGARDLTAELDVD